MIKAITFDLDEVYFPNGTANFIKSLGQLGISEDEAKRVFLKSDQMNKLYKCGQLSDDKFWTWAAGEWGLAKSPQELIDMLISGYEVDQKVINTIKSVRDNGYKTLVCSNNFPARVTGLQKKFGFLDNFDAAVFSCEVGAAKPAEIIFKELIRQAGVLPEEIVFADNYPPNLTNVQNLGITTFLYEGFDKFVEKLIKIGVKI